MGGKVLNLRCPKVTGKLDQGGCKTTAVRIIKKIQQEEIEELITVHQKTIEKETKHQTRAAGGR